MNARHGAGALVGAGHWAFWPVWLTVLGAEVLADTLLYLLGRFGNHPRVAPVLRRLGLTDERRERWTSMATRSPARMVLTVKVVDVLAAPAFIAAGPARVSYRRLIGWVAAGAAARCAVRGAARDRRRGRHAVRVHAGGGARGRQAFRRA